MPRAIFHCLACRPTAAPVEVVAVLAADVDLDDDVGCLVDVDVEVVVTLATEPEPERVVWLADSLLVVEAGNVDTEEVEKLETVSDVELLGNDSVLSDVELTLAEGIALVLKLNVGRILSGSEG